MNRVLPSRFVTSLMLMGAVVCGHCQSLPQKVAVTPATVAAALSRQGLAVTAEQLEMPARLSASGTPDLQVDRAELVAPQTLRVRMMCMQTSQCQPFLVLVHLPADARDLVTLAALEEPSAKRGATTVLHGDHLVAGQHVTLVMEDKHMRISLPVIAIDSGAHGAAVRVASLDHKQSYQATVESAAVVRGVLP